MNAVDHVLIAVPDLEAGAALVLDRFGLAAMPGGSPWPGVTNLVVPIGPPAYLELVTVTDPEASPEAAVVAGMVANGARLLTWVIEPDDFDATVARIGLKPSGEPDAGWRTLGGVRPDRPFFIRYSRDREARRTGWQTRYEQAGHRSTPGGLAWVEVGGDEATVRDWTGELDVPLRFTGGEPGLSAIAITTPDGEMVIRDSTLA